MLRTLSGLAYQAWWLYIPTRDDYRASGMVHPTEYLKNRFQHRFLTSTNPRNTMARPLEPPEPKDEQADMSSNETAA